jgi:hypothetical protein
VPKYKDIIKQIRNLISGLIATGLTDDQNFPSERRGLGGCKEITFPGASHTSVAMKDTSYINIYDHLNRERAYLVKMADGALIQIMYAFKGSLLERHRLAFFPSPHLVEFQNSPQIYMEDEMYAEIVAKNIVPFPFRFDFDIRDDIFKVLDHPKSHLTLGQYTNCRIPVSAPLMPAYFVDFILRNFYNTAQKRHCDCINFSIPKAFSKTIHPQERSVVHMQVPES